MAKVLAYVSGTALAPGVSRNGRLYTAEAIGKAVRRAQARIAEGKRPIAMYAYHETTNTRELVGGVTKVWQESDGSAKYIGAIADTSGGRDIASLVDPEGDEPAFLRGVSIKGNWVGGSHRERGPGGSLVETGSDLEIGRLDYTSEPGVNDAGVDTFRHAGAGDGESGETYTIAESAPEALVETAITEETTPAAPVAEAAPQEVREALRGIFEPGHILMDGLCVTCAGVGEAATVAMSRRGSGIQGKSGTTYADPGYQADKKQRYELDTAAHIRAAWSFISRAVNASKYTPAQLKRIKGRIKAAAGKAGIQIAAEGWTVAPALLVTEALAEYAGDPACAGSYSLTACNGPTTVSVSGYGLDPADLTVILQAACSGASAALCTLDPDMDADMDVEGADAEDTDGDMAGGDGPGYSGGGPIDADRLAARIAAAIKGESADDPESLITEAREARTAGPAVAEAAEETARTESPAPQEAADPHREEPAVSEATTTEAVAPATAAPSYSQADLDAAVERALAAKKARKAAKKARAAESAPEAPVKEAAPASGEAPDLEKLVEERLSARLAAEGLTETLDQKVERLVQARVTEAKQQLAAQGMGPGRKGLVAEHSAARAAGGGELPPDFPMKDGQMLRGEWTEEQRRAVGSVLQDYVLGDRAVY